MIVDQLPEVQRLSPEHKLALAAELFESVTDCGGGEPDPEIVGLLEARLAAYHENPADVSPWLGVKARILGNRAS